MIMMMMKTTDLKMVAATAIVGLSHVLITIRHTVANTGS